MFHSASLNVQTCTSFISSPEKLDNVWKHYTRKMFRVQSPWYSNFITSPCTLNVSWSAKSSGRGSSGSLNEECSVWEPYFDSPLLRTSPGWVPVFPHLTWPWAQAILQHLDIACPTYFNIFNAWHRKSTVPYSLLRTAPCHTLPYLASNFSQLSLSDKGAFWLGPGHKKKVHFKCLVWLWSSMRS